MNELELVKLSKMLSKHLRHRPEAIGIELEPGGWVAIDNLLTAFARKGFTLSRATLEEVVRRNDKQRFGFDAAGERIRANQGHSVPVDLELESLEPPIVLYHGTNHLALSEILERGLQRMSRHHVHLSSDLTLAYRVGGRRGRAVVLQIFAERMYADGFTFFKSENEVWLVEHVPTRYLEVYRERRS